MGTARDCSIGLVSDDFPFFFAIVEAWSAVDAPATTAGSEAERGARREVGAHGPPQLGDRAPAALGHEPRVLQGGEVAPSEVGGSQGLDGKAYVGLGARLLHGGPAGVVGPDPPGPL